MSDEQGELDFSDAPISLAERRAAVKQDGRLWSPRDALVDMLRSIDRKEIDVEAMVICYRRRREDDGRSLHYTLAGDVPRVMLTGIVDSVSYMIKRDAL